jgi:anti-sigma factor RsiW
MLTAYLDGELAPRDKEALEAHLTGCEVCGEELRSLRSLRQAWAEPPSIASTPADRAAIIAEARARAAHEEGWLERLAGWLTPTDLVTAGAVMASIVLAIVLTGRWSDRGLPEGWPNSVPVYTIEEYRARLEGTEIEGPESFRLDRYSPVDEADREENR